MPHSARPRGSAGLTVGHADCGRACPRKGIGAAQGVGQPVAPGHAPDQIRRVGAGYPGRSDEQRAYRGSAHDRHRVGSRAEPGLGHPDHRDAELGVRMRTQAGSAAGVQIGIAIDHSRPRLLRPSRTARSGGSSRR